MKKALLFALAVLSMSTQSLAVDYEEIQLLRDSVSIYVKKGGALSPTTEAVADYLNSITEKGTYDCSAKFFKAAHQGVYVYTIFDIKDCEDHRRR